MKIIVPEGQDPRSYVVYHNINVLVCTNAGT